MARHAALDGADVQEELPIRLERPIPLEHERGRAGVQPPVRVRRPRRRSHGGPGQAVEDRAS